MFDVLLLGMGPDGHTCSLFPGHKEIENKMDIVTYIEDSPKPPKQRITLTLPVLNNASHVFFIVTGKDKKNCLDAIRDGTSQSPSSRVSPTSGDCIWFADPAAYGNFSVCFCKPRLVILDHGHRLILHWHVPAMQTACCSEKRLEHNSPQNLSQ